MPKLSSFIYLCLSATFLYLCTQTNQYKSAQEKLSEIYPLKKPPQEGDWLYTRTDKYQSLDEYIQSKPTRIDSIRKKIYMDLIGNFDNAQKEIVDTKQQVQY